VKKLEDILFITQARLNSERLPRKMLKPFAGSNLMEICLNKMQKSKYIPAANLYLSAYEPELIDLAEKMGVNVFHRSLESITDEGITLQKIYEWYKKLPFKYYVMVSACFPLLNVETIDKFIQHFINSPHEGLFAVVERRTYYWDKNGKMLNDWPAGKLLDTKIVDPIYEAGHCLYGGTMEQIGRGLHMGSFAEKNDPELFVIDNEKEAFDIDWPWQFEVNELLYDK
jgi:CMP-N-acetylneuraminic acid synthetase